MIKNIIIEGLDRLGKSSLIDGIKNNLGYYQVIHYQKPEFLKIYKKQAIKDLEKCEIDPFITKEDLIKRDVLKLYQEASFINMFKMLSGDGNFILDRAHLGEDVYSHRYRNYNGGYVFELEKAFAYQYGSNFHKNTLLVLLKTSNFDFLVDDGLSHNFSKKEEEQVDFERAFKKSIIKNKIIIDVHDGNGFYSPKEKILNLVLERLK